MVLNPIPITSVTIAWHSVLSDILVPTVLIPVSLLAHSLSTNMDITSVECVSQLLTAMAMYQQE